MEAKKLTDDEIERMIDMFASSPLYYKHIDKRLIELCLLQIWDDTENVYEPSFDSKDFYNENGTVNNLWRK